MSSPRRLRFAVLCPHFEPDTAPTGVVMTLIVTELAAQGHEIDVITALPWYRTHAVEPDDGRTIRHFADDRAADLRTADRRGLS